MKNSVVAAAVLLALMGGVAHAQTAAPAAAPAATPAKSATPAKAAPAKAAPAKAAPAKAAPAKATAASTDPVVVMRAEQRAARTAFTDATRPIRAERAATVKAAEDKAMADAKTAGKDPPLARRSTNRATMAATRVDFEARTKGPATTRDTALAAATAKRNAASKQASKQARKQARTRPGTHAHGRVCFRPPSSRPDRRGCA